MYSVPGQSQIDPRVTAVLQQAEQEYFKRKEQEKAEQEHSHRLKILKEQQAREMH